ncbi:iron chelate uptake ABC transporter family permease subunit [Streptomyces sp. L7]
MIVAISIGAVNVPLGDVWAIVLHHVTGVEGGTLGPRARPDRLELPYPARGVGRHLVGAALAVSGAVLQTVVSNPLADPIVLGFSYRRHARRGPRHHPGRRCRARRARGVGGGLHRRGGGGARWSSRSDSGGADWPPPGWCWRGSPSAMSSSLRPASSNSRRRRPRLRTVMFWMLGGGVRCPVGPTPHGHRGRVLVTTALLTLFGRRLNVLLAGDESATALGVDVNRLRAVLLVLSALLTGTVIAVAGSIGFVGLMIPHLVRLTTGADHRRLLTPDRPAGLGLRWSSSSLLSRILQPPQRTAAGHPDRPPRRPLLPVAVAPQQGPGLKEFHEAHRRPTPHHPGPQPDPARCEP